MRIALSRRMADIVGDEVRATAADCEFLLIDPEAGLSDEASATTQVWFLSSDLIEAFKYEPKFAEACDAMVATAPLRWVQSGSSGHERPIFQRILERGAVLTSGAGIHSVPIAQYVLSHMLAQVKRHRDHATAQAKREWIQLDQGELTGRTVGIAGYGGIGAEVARLSKAFGMTVLVCRRDEAALADVDAVYGPGDLAQMAAQCDFLVVALPLTSKTRGLIGREALSAMKASASLINVARGAIVDEEALIEALRAGRPGYAVLDVATVEPLDRASPLWTLRNVTITPHDSAWSPLAYPRLGRLFCDNLARFVAGSEMLNLVQSEPGRPTTTE